MSKVLLIFGVLQTVAGIFGKKGDSRIIRHSLTPFATCPNPLKDCSTRHVPPKTTTFASP
ncbi:hypothetical protein [Candidatus Contendibacter odensensis]|uniref:hypothetical protein n=1 Tax=Candidatus Contendibacter odensensis TaxID=1400860 RepID=UPI0004B71493|nr:hypothetical protein [Candidatus Contendobacter odensis]